MSKLSRRTLIASCAALAATGAAAAVIKTGAEIPFTRYFYKYQQPEASEVLAARFVALESSVNERIQHLFGQTEGGERHA